MNAATGNMTALPEAGPNDGGASGARTVLSARGLGKSFGGFYAVKNVDLDVEHARVHALIGPNGAGKTTVFNLLTKFLQPTSGEITLLGETITKTDPARVARMGLVRSFQISATFPHLTVLENVKVALQRPTGLLRSSGVRCRHLIGSMRRPSNFWNASVWPMPAMRWPLICPMVASAHWKSPPRWRSIRKCCCSMSRWRAWVMKTSTPLPPSLPMWRRIARS